MAESVNRAALTVLKNSEWFRGIEESLLQEIAALSVPRKYQAGEIVFQRYEPGDHLYGVISGAVRVTVQAPDGRELALNTMRSGDIIGEIAVLDGGTRTASGNALEPTVAFVIPREPFTELMLRQPTIALHMIKLLCERVRHTSEQVEEVAFLSLNQRLALLLQRLVDESNDDVPCTIKISQSELGSFLNSSRQAVNGALQAWQKEGFISLKRGRIVVHDLAGLLEAAQTH